MFKEKLANMGIKRSNFGILFLNLTLQEYEEGCKVTELYSDVVDEYNKTHKRQTAASRVERAIRHAVTNSTDPMKNGDFITKYSMLWKAEPKPHVSLEIPFMDETEELKSGIDYQISTLSTVDTDNIPEERLELIYNMLKAVNSMTN